MLCDLLPEENDIKQRFSLLFIDIKISIPLSAFLNEEIENQEENKSYEWLPMFFVYKNSILAEV